MSDLITITRARRPKPLPDIVVSGQTWKARKKLAVQFGIDDRTAKRRRWRTKLVGGVAYCSEAEAIADLFA